MTQDAQAPPPRDIRKEKSTAVLKDEPATQEKKGFRENWPMWLKQLPRLQFPQKPNETWKLISDEDFEEFIRDYNCTPEAAEKIRADLQYMDYELLRLFRERDHEAKYQQNRYRLFQLGYILLATIATFIGSLMAISLNSNPRIVPLLSFLETVVALATTYLATISGREAPLPLWIDNRRRAEMLRREYFRYVMDLEPYSNVDSYEREMLLSKRAAEINRGHFPENTE